MRARHYVSPRTAFELADPFVSGRLSAVLAAADKVCVRGLGRLRDEAEPSAFDCLTPFYDPIYVAPEELAPLA